MDMSEQQLQQIDVNIEFLENMVKLDDALARLQENKDFQLLIEDGFFKEEAARAVLFRADPECQRDGHALRDTENIITSIGGLFQYFHKIRVMASRARQDIEEDKETREAILAEQLQGAEAGSLQ